MLEVDMEQHTKDPPGNAEWGELGDRIEQAKRLLPSDPLLALTQLAAVQADAGDFLDDLMKYAVTEARQKGYKWREIATVTGVEDRQAAWRRWTDKGVPKTRRRSGSEELSTP